MTYLTILTHKCTVEESIRLEQWYGIAHEKQKGKQKSNFS